MARRLANQRTTSPAIQRTTLRSRGAAAVQDEVAAPSRTHAAYVSPDAEARRVNSIMAAATARKTPMGERPAHFSEDAVIIGHLNRSFVRPFVPTRGLRLRHGIAGNPF